MIFYRTLMASASLMAVARASGIGKAWEVSQVQNGELLSTLSSRPRLESSAFEIRSVSGVGRMSPVAANQQELSTRSSFEEATSESSSGPRLVEVTPKSRQAKELEDLEATNFFVPAIDFYDPTIEAFLRRSKVATDVEALPSMWRKFRRHDRNGGNREGHCSEVEELDEPVETYDHDDEKSRIRRDTEPEMEKIGVSKSVRQARLDSPDSWSKQPLSVEFRSRAKPDEIAENEDKSARSTSRGIQAPQVDFVTSNRRSFTENRESRDLPLPASVRSYDDIPIYRNIPRDRDPVASYPRGRFYPESYRTERDYFVRGPEESNYRQDRYRENDFDLYGRSRPMPKPKRIIYYATLPEIIRKPVDLRNYPRPYDTLTRSSIPSMAADGYYKRRTGSSEPTRYRYYSRNQPNYESSDRFAKRPSWMDRMYDSYAERMEDSRQREQDIDHASLREEKNEETMLELGHERKMVTKPRDQDKLPWSVQIGTEVSVKDNERITGRKIFGQREDFHRFRNDERAVRERDQSGKADRN